MRYSKSSKKKTIFRVEKLKKNGSSDVDDDDGEGGWWGVEEFTECRGNYRGAFEERRE